MRRNELAIYSITLNKNSENMDETLKPAEIRIRMESVLAAQGVPLANALAALEHYVSLVREWNTKVSLVSARDSERLWESHLPDSLSLAGEVASALDKGYTWLDIGPGAGFPALPIRLLLGRVSPILCERSEKKSKVLRDLLDQLGLEDVTLITGEFPVVTPHPDTPVIITARAVEKPAHFHKLLSKWMLPKDCFLCQAAEVSVELRRGMFHVELVDDAWTKAGLRRGKLWRVRRGGK